MKHKASITEISWKEARTEIESVNPDLYACIESINPNDDFTVFKARYPYGTKICHYGKFYLPCDDGTVVSINSKKIPDNIRRVLSYNPMPVILVTHHNVEVFSEPNDRFVPVEIFMPGAIFGTWEIFDEPHAKEKTRDWSFGAGARSTFLLPSATNNENHNKLCKKYKASLVSPKSLFDQHELFKSITNHNNFEQEWYCEVIFFPEKWVKSLQATVKDNKWVAFQYLLLIEAWKYSTNWRNQLSISLILHSLVQEIDKKNMRTRPYLIDTVKHLIAIAMGTTLAFRPALDEESIPLTGLQKAYINDYGMKKYIPTIMEPSYLEDNQQAVYYSLQYPTLLTYSQSGFRSVMKDLQDVQYLMDLLLPKLKQEKHSMYQLLKGIKFNYYHSEVSKSTSNIKLIEEIAKDDDRFLKIFGESHVNKCQIPHTASFFRGCIGIIKVK